MILKSWLYICLVMLFFTETSTHNCNELHRWLHNVNKSNLELLTSKMRTKIPLQCVDNGGDFMATQGIIKKIQECQKSNAKEAIHEIFKQTLHIFNQNHTETMWDDCSITVFQNGLYQQIKQLQSCMSANVEDRLTSPRGQNIQLIRLRVKRYFQRIKDFLRNKQYCLCAWEIIQMEVKQCFMLVDQLTKRLKKRSCCLCSF